MEQRRQWIGRCLKHVRENRRMFAPKDTNCSRAPNEVAFPNSWPGVLLFNISVFLYLGINIY